MALSSRSDLPLTLILGVVIPAGPQTLGSNIHVWGVGDAVPVDARGDWAPTHSVLDGYNAAPYSDCRSTSPRRFYSRELKALSVPARRIAIYTYFRVERWLYLRLRMCLVLFSLFVLLVAGLVAILYQ